MADYWNDAALKIAKGATDNKYAAKTKKPATGSENYVSDLQKDLIVPGYLKAGAEDGSFGAGSERAVKRFQRHAARAFRMLNGTKVAAVPWVGTATGVCDQSTAKEVRAWIDKQYRLPVGIYQLVAIEGGKLRDDAAKAWKAALADVVTKGGTLLPPG